MGTAAPERLRSGHGQLWLTVGFRMIVTGKTSFSGCESFRKPISSVHALEPRLDFVSRKAQRTCPPITSRTGCRDDARRRPFVSFPGLLPVNPAALVLGKSPASAALQLYSAADYRRQVFIPLDLQDHRRIPRRNRDAVGIEKIHALEPRADVLVNRHPHVARFVYKGRTRVIHNHAGA